MLNLNVIHDDIVISSINKEDICCVQKWIEKQNHCLDERIYANSLDMDEFMKRFIEYYVCEDEIFFKIEKDSKIIGLVKGRLEHKETQELFIWFFMVDTELRNKGIGRKILNVIMDYFNNNMDTKVFSAGVCSSDTKAINFWEENCFSLVRITKNFFKADEDEGDLMVYKKICS
ncbi:GNAT family N-acetyltransferase [Clostridium polynesiense]|uniref:GNAT family N-acetyltransferase n=1 Tax=Clostridium polynesiense TaxID=1325933 RepID=UPI0006931F67|nr:GNAT family N-acetyltransferase [Clostridium polynesiense]